MRIIKVFILILFFSFSFALAKEEERPKRGSIDVGSGKPIRTNKASISALNKAFANVSEQIAHSVVSVSTFAKGISQDERNRQLFEYFFGRPYPKEKKPNQQEAPEQPLGAGSGFIISEQGHILTNAHVVKQASRVQITLFNKQTYEADIVGVDEKTDVAVVKINAPAKELQPVLFGSSDDLEIGEWVIAIGNPFGYTNTITTGIISATGRRSQFYQNGGYYNFIQTDAAINPGNSGGPLVNLKGEVIGINTLIVSRSGGYQGLSFAIPVRMAKKVAEDLIYEGRVIRGFLGVQINNVSSDLALALGLKPGYGAQIESLVEDAPAMRAGFKIGDIITKIDNIEVEDASFLRNRVSELAPGEIYPFAILREGEARTIDVRIGSLDKSFSYDHNEQEPQNIYGEYSAPHLGFKFRSLPKEKAKELHLDKGTGIIVSEIISSSIARNIKINDIMISYKRAKDRKFQKIKNPEDFFKILKNIKSEESIAFNVYSNGKNRLKAIRARKFKK